MLSLFIFKTSFLRDYFTDPLLAKADSLHGLLFHAKHGLIVADEPVWHQFELFYLYIYPQFPIICNECLNDNYRSLSVNL